MNPAPKHVPFDSVYRPNFEVVAERQGKVTLFPHTAQLPLLLRALNLEFYGSLPDYLARVDRRGDGFHKYMLRSAALLFAIIFQGARKDDLHLLPLPDADFVTRLTVVQQITEDHPLGRFHRFRFYGRDGFFPDIYLSGKRLAFADHVLDRFSSRVPNQLGEDLAFFLTLFFGSAFISLPVGQGRAFVLPYGDSLVAFTYTETAEEFFVTTCLTIKEIHSLRLEQVPVAHNLHYGPDFVRPKIRNWYPFQHMLNMYERWQKKIPLPPPVEKTGRLSNWKKVAHLQRDASLQSGYGPGTHMCFFDNLPGPMIWEFKPGQQEAVHDEQAAYAQADPRIDWAAALAERDATTSETPDEHLRRTRP